MDGVGGARFAFPLLGDTVYARLNLALRSLEWAEEVLTREALPCRIKLSVWWRVGKMEAFIAGSGTAKQLEVNDAKETSLSIAESRLLTLTEATTRSILAQASFLEVLTAVKPQYLDVHHRPEEAPPGLAELSSDLAKRLSEVLKREAASYGIEIDRVEVRDIRFAQQVEQELREVWLSYLKPVRAEQEAEADRIAGMKKLELLAREVDLLGGAAISTREIVKHLPDNSNLTLEDLLASIVSAARATSGQNVSGSQGHVEARVSAGARLIDGRPDSSEPA
jgi:regulator of protease activity HflC (stomatin/prohibitin superfamily)